MFGIDGGEFVVIAIVALVVIGPKDLPRVMSLVGQWVGKARAMSRHVRSGFDTMMREAELEEMQKQWDAQNAAIIASTNVELPKIDMLHADLPDLDASLAHMSSADTPHMLPLDAEPIRPDEVTIVAPQDAQPHHDAADNDPASLAHVKPAA